LKYSTTFHGIAPDFQSMPVGNAGNITAYWKGYKEYHAAGKSDSPAANARLSRRLVLHPSCWDIRSRNRTPSPRPSASAILPAGSLAEAARDESGGLIDMVTDDEIRDAYSMLARTEGVFCEPASAASIAGLKKLADQGFFDTVDPP
jgi:threonine synthase